MPGAERLLHTTEPSPLATAARHPDRRLRLAAVEALLRIHPAQPFAGASHVPEALAFHGLRRPEAAAWLIGSPRIERAQRLVGIMARLGLQADTATTSRELLAKAFRSADYELILVETVPQRPHG